MKVSISSNNRDYSDEYFEYLYLPLVEVTTVDPLWVVNGAMATITVNGFNFFSTPDL